MSKSKAAKKATLSRGEASPITAQSLGNVSPIRPDISITGQWSQTDLNQKIEGYQQAFATGRDTVAEVAQAFVSGLVTVAMLSNAHQVYGKADSGKAFFGALKVGIYRAQAAKAGGSIKAGTKYPSVRVNPQGVLTAHEAKARGTKTKPGISDKVKALRSWLVKEGHGYSTVEAMKAECDKMFAGLIAELRAVAGK